MKPFTQSNDLLMDPSALRKRLRDDGYLFLREIIPRDTILELRKKILEICQEAQWLRPGSNLMDGLTDHPPVMERDEEYAPVYARIQALEAFHRLKFQRAIIGIMEQIFQEPVIPFPQTIGRVAFPRDNERGTQPHQDWIFVGGSLETLSCWVPLGDTPMEVGGLKVLAGSHKAGFLEPRPAPGPGGRTVDVDTRLDWVQSDYRSGDILLFKMLTVHAAATNLTKDRLRLSVDLRYTGESHVVADEWLEPHFSSRGEPFTWKTLEKDWQDSPIAHYWKKLPKLHTKPHRRFWEK